MSVCSTNQGHIHGCVCLVHVSVTSLYSYLQVSECLFVCGETVCLSLCEPRTSVCLCNVCVCVLRSGEQSRPGLSVPPDVTLLSAGTDPAAEVGRPTCPSSGWGRAPGEGMGGWHPGSMPNIRQIQACMPNNCFHSGD